MNIRIFNNLTEKDKSDAVEELIENSTPNQDFFTMVILSILMASFGLLLNSSAVIIGSMLIAPILFPVLSLSLGIVMSDSKLISRSLYTLLKSIGIGVVAAIIVAIFFPLKETVNYEIIARAQPSLLYIAVAVVAGLAASFALVKPKLSATLPGIAISVALIPPLAVVGIGIAKGNWEIISGSFVLFLINILGIIFASMMVFSLMNLYVKRGVAKEVIKQEDKELLNEKKNS